jgi:polyisoprenoid-binding protein YceI
MRRHTMIRRSISYISTVLLLILAMPVLQGYAQGQKVVVHLDPAQSEIHWTLSATTHTVKGTFKLKGGVLIFDTVTGAAQGEMLVDTESGESGSGSRDEKMKKEVLETGKYPQAFFHATKVTGVLKPGSTQDMAAEGTFNVHGADHPLTLRLKVQMVGDQATVTTRFAVPYVAWGMKDPSFMMFRVGKQVDVDVVARGSVEGPK